MTSSPAPTAARPLLRWTGGKKRLLPQLLAALPQTFNGQYFEPFFGGGALYFALLRDGRLQADNAWINDLNPAIMCLYRTLKVAPDELTAELRTLEAAMQKTGGEPHYYLMRTDLNARLAALGTDPDPDPEFAARMLYLNRTGFNGLWRVNAKGALNVPWGRLKKPLIVAEDLLPAVSEALPPVEQTLCTEYLRVSRHASAGDVVYFDPPYIPHTPTASFTKYHADDFSRRDQFTLAGHIRGLVADGVHVALSNADDTAGVARKIFDGCTHFGSRWHVLQVSVTRSVSAKASTRGSVNEILCISWDAADADVSTLADLDVKWVSSCGDPRGWDALPHA